MAFREVSVVEIREILRRWQRGQGLRTVAAGVGVDRKTVRRYVESAKKHGFSRDDETSVALDDELLGAVTLDLLPGPPESVGEMRQHCRAQRELIEGWVRDGLRVPRIARQLQRHTGVAVPLRTLGRFIAEDLPAAKTAGGTVRIVDPDPGQVLEVDFMQVGRFVLDGERTTLHALVCVAANSRHTFVWPCLSMTRADVIEGLDAAWQFFGGVFPIVLTDNMSAVVDRADPIAPVVNAHLLEYSQERGFLFDLARVRHPKDKARVERTVRYVREDAFKAEKLLSLEHARWHAVQWCRDVAGQRVHGTTRRRPQEAFDTDEKNLLLPVPSGPYDMPTWHRVTVGPDYAITVAKALYSVPYAYRGKTLRVRVDAQWVRMYDRGTLVKVHPRAAAGDSTIDGADLPPGKGDLATRDAEALLATAARRGSHIGTFAERMLDDPRPWTRMRFVYQLLHLCRQYGNESVDEVCATALEHDVLEVKRVARMLALARPAPPPPPARGAEVARPRFARNKDAFRPPGGHHAS